MQHPAEMRNPAGDTAGLAKNDLAINNFDHTDLRADAQRRLVRKLVAGAGLSVAVASVLVITALGDGGRA